MAKAAMKKLSALFVFCSLLEFGGCLNSGVTRDILVEGVTQAGLEFLLDNNVVFDLFTDN